MYLDKSCPLNSCWAQNKHVFGIPFMADNPNRDTPSWYSFRSQAAKGFVTTTNSQKTHTLDEENKIPRRSGEFFLKQFHFYVFWMCPFIWTLNLVSLKIRNPEAKIGNENEYVFYTCAKRDTQHLYLQSACIYTILPRSQAWSKHNE